MVYRPFPLESSLEEMISVKISFETERLILKVSSPKFAKEVSDYYIRNKDFLKPWEPLRDEQFFTVAHQAKELNEDLNSFKKGNSLRLWLFKKDSNKLIGVTGFSNIIMGVFLSCFLGYKLDKDEINKGYMTEALKKGIEIMFNEYQLHRIEANIIPRNKASLKVVEKLGFQNEGLAKKYLNINGKWEDHVHMVLLNERLE